MKILVTGATGTAGAATVEMALKDTGISGVTALVRRPVGITHPKLTEVIHQDFLDYSKLGQLFQSHDAIIWCLGVSQFEVDETTYRTITKDYAIAAATAAAAANPNITFVFLSGEGADPSGNTPALFAKVKGETETALQSLPLKRLYIARPAGIQPTEGRHVRVWQYRLVVPFYPLIQLIAPGFVIADTKLGQAMLELAEAGGHDRIYNNRMLRTLAEQYQTSHGK